MADVEALIATVARAFYDDECVCLVDVLLRDKYLRDDDMGPRLSLPAKQLRRTLQFLQEEFLVKYELVDDLNAGGSQATKFWYIDYHQAVNVVRLRVFLLRQKLEKAELRARSSSVFLCPGYKQKTCNGRYTETEAQQVLDPLTGLFLCRECVASHAANPNAPPKDTYTLQLVDNTRVLRKAVDDMRRVSVQLTAKAAATGGASGTHTHTTQQLRAGVYDLLQKVRSHGRGLTSNFPSENLALGIGSNRLAGTGRTAGIKAKKLAQQGVVTGAASVRNYLGGATRSEEGSDLTFLKNAMGEEVAFEVEKGGGARANLLATQGRKRSKLMDAAASRVGIDIPPGIKLLMSRKRAKVEERAKNGGASNKKAKGSAGFSFLQNNIGRASLEQDEEIQILRRKKQEDDAKDEGDTDDDNDDDDDDDRSPMMDGDEQLWRMEEEERRSRFQAQYKLEKARQMEFIKPTERELTGSTHLAPLLVSDDCETDMDYDQTVQWEDA
eukprot:scaffold8467_cov59-Attheya_sp.AAC.4